MPFLRRDPAPRCRQWPRRPTILTWEDRYRGVQSVAYDDIGRAVAGVSGPWDGRFVITWWLSKMNTASIEVLESREQAMAAVAMGPPLGPSWSTVPWWRRGLLRWRVKWACPPVVRRTRPSRAVHSDQDGGFAQIDGPESLLSLVRTECQ